MSSFRENKPPRDTSDTGQPFSSSGMSNLEQLRANAARFTQLHQNSEAIDKARLGQQVTDQYPYLDKTPDPAGLDMLRMEGNRIRKAFKPNNRLPADVSTSHVHQNSEKKGTLSITNKHDIVASVSLDHIQEHISDLKETIDSFEYKNVETKEKWQSEDLLYIGEATAAYIKTIIKNIEKGFDNQSSESINNSIIELRRNSEDINRNEMNEVQDIGQMRRHFNNLNKHLDMALDSTPVQRERA